jgi:photosystem II stability/assembly factor-like uncharacterized protein
MIALIGIALFGYLLPGCTGHSNMVTAIAINPHHPNILFITTNDSVYKSRDDGATWITVTKGLGHARILSLAVDPANGSIIYAGTLGDAVYRSVDGGNRWSIINAGMKEHVAYVNGFVFHPQDPQTILAATTVGIFKTINGGMMWQEMPTKGMDSVYTVSAVMDPTATNILYAGTSGGVYKSVNGGMTWKEANNGLLHLEPGTALSLGVNALAMDPVKSTTLYAGTTQGAFKTVDGAASWTKIQEGIGEEFVAAIVVHPTEKMTLFVGTQTGVYKTKDGGEHWDTLNNGLTNLNIRALAMHPKDPNIMYAGTQGGLFKTIDRGAHWTDLMIKPKG